ncbi:MAG: hypothetical protein QOI80_1942 [Solirubrobacteraceae bacterium]|jgi:hypothetical protein|nr:hypothetical protein [Solirubrobacteraceae bacterium]
MAQKPRQVRMESKSAMAAMQRLETKSDEELHAETRFKSAAQAILGARAAERYDAKAAREHFRTAIASARPQERLQLRRMAEASLALAERRPDDLRAAAVKLGQEPPSNRQLLALRFMGLVAPGGNAPMWRRVAGFFLLIAIILALLAIGWVVVKLVALPLGGVDNGIAIFYGFLVVAAVLGVLAFRGRRKQQAARAARGQPT